MRTQSTAPFDFSEVFVNQQEMKASFRSLALQKVVMKKQED
jgi:hypothetical protein